MLAEQLEGAHHQHSLCRLASLCPEQQKHSPAAKKGHVQEFPISHHTEEAASKVFVLALKRERGRTVPWLRLKSGFEVGTGRSVGH